MQIAITESNAYSSLSLRRLLSEERLKRNEVISVGYENTSPLRRVSSHSQIEYDDSSSRFLATAVETIEQSNRRVRLR